MWQSALILILGTFIVLIGWVIGRLFRTPSVVKNTGDAVMDEFYWLVDNIKLDPSNPRKARAYNRRLRKHIRQASRYISVEVRRARPDRKISLSVRSIGKWTFSTAPDCLSDHDASVRHNPGLAFLSGGQTVIQAFMTGDANQLRLTFQPGIANAGDQRTGGYAFKTLTLNDLKTNKAQSGRLAAHMAAGLASRHGEWRTTLIEISNRLLPDYENVETDLISRAAMDRGAFEDLYLYGWLKGELGRENRDRNCLDCALSIFRRLIDLGLTKRAGTEAAIIETNASRAALASYELYGDNPERLLEADDYCQLARARCEAQSDPGFTADLNLLRVRIHRRLAAHDRSLKGFDRAGELLRRAEEISRKRVGVGHRDGLYFLEAGRIAQARAETSGDPGLLLKATRAFGAALKEFKAEGGYGAKIEAEALTGLAECLICIGCSQTDPEMIKRALQVTRKADQWADMGPGAYATLRECGVDKQLKLLHVKALGALGRLSGEAGYINEALEKILKIPKVTSGASTAQGLDDDCAMIRAGLLLDRADITRTTAHYGDAVNGIGAVGVRRVMPEPSGNKELRYDWCDLYSGLVRGLYILARQDGRRATSRRAEEEAHNLRALAKSRRNPMRLAEAECLLADILTLHQDDMSFGNADMLRTAINAMRRALELTPRHDMPAFWAKRQTRLGALLAKYGELTDDVVGLEAAISTFEKSLGVGNDEQTPIDRAVTLHQIGQTLTGLAARTGDRSDKMRAQAALERAYDASAAHQLQNQARMAEQNLMRLRRARA